MIPSATVSQVTGTAQIQRGGASLPAQAGTPVKLHDVVTTQPGSTATLSFPDGSSNRPHERHHRNHRGRGCDQRAERARAG